MIYRRFDVHIGTCEHCGRTVRGQHDLQTSTTSGAAASQLGPHVHALLTILNKELGLSHGKSVRLLGTLFPELHIARATSVRSSRTAEHADRPMHNFAGISGRVRGRVRRDELRVGGRSAWLHAFVSKQGTVM